MYLREVEPVNNCSVTHWTNVGGDLPFAVLRFWSLLPGNGQKTRDHQKYIQASPHLPYKHCPWTAEQMIAWGTATAQHRGNFSFQIPIFKHWALTRKWPSNTYVYLVLAGFQPKGRIWRGRIFGKITNSYHLLNCPRFIPGVWAYLQISFLFPLVFKLLSRPYT